MQLTGQRRRTPAPTFVNHTTRDFEITASNTSQSPQGDTYHDNTLVGTGTATMGSSSSSTAHATEELRRASSTILREDSILQVSHPKSGELSRPDSWSMHFDCTDQAPYASSKNDKMMTQTSLLTLPKTNASHDLAHFLRSTGPCQRRPSKMEKHGRVVSAPKIALKFLKGAHRRPSAPVASAHQRLNEALADPGGLLSEEAIEPPPKGTEQRVTSHGKKYLALQVKPVETAEVQDEAIPTQSPDILESRVSVSFGDDLSTSEVLDNWLLTLNSQQEPSDGTSKPSGRYDVSPVNDSTVRMVPSSSPVRAAASNPPSPAPDSGRSLADSYIHVLPEHPAKRAFDVSGALSSHPLITALPTMPDRRDVLKVVNASPGREVEIKHPSPRRFASHPVLLQRASSIASSLQPRSVSDSPGPPPPRSPLRLKKDARSIESMLGRTTSVRKTTPSVKAPSIKGSLSEVDAPIKACVITECTGPIRPPKSRGKSILSHPAYPTSRKEREERSRARKLRDRPYQAQTIDTLITAPPVAPPRRLRKARPHIAIPALKPLPLGQRESSTASSDASGKKVAGEPEPVSEVSAASKTSKTGYTPTSAVRSTDSAAMALSPVMLVAEEVPAPKARPTPKPAKLILRERSGRRAAVPRPRSASIPRAALRRSGLLTPSRPSSPDGTRNKDTTPLLPSPPPNRALPPTPPASGSEKTNKVRTTALTTTTRKALPTIPPFEISPKSPKQPSHQPHVATLDQRNSTTSPKGSKLEARLEALERSNAAVTRQNKLLEAALMAVLKANGVSNFPAVAESAVAAAPPPLVWENRVARRSAASHATSGSNGSALDVYMSARRGSRAGC